MVVREESLHKARNKQRQLTLCVAYGKRYQVGT